MSRGVLQRQRKEGVRKASVRDFHSFRVTWVTLALSAGVPLEIVQRVTGHRTESVVMKHYFQPGRDEFRRTLAGKMPALLVGGEEKPKAAPEAVDLTNLRSRLAGMSEEKGLHGLLWVTWGRYHATDSNRAASGENTVALEDAFNFPLNCFILSCFRWFSARLTHNKP